MKKVLVVIDLQRDYFVGGLFPLWQADEVCNKVEKLMINAHENNVPIVLIQHIADKNQEDAPFFIEGTQGVKLHPKIERVAGDARIVVKTQLDAFEGTKLELALQELGAEEIVVCGMMTQNCVTHTVLSKSAEKYTVNLIPECCTTMNKMIHDNAIRNLSTRVGFVTMENAF